METQKTTIIDSENYNEYLNVLAIDPTKSDADPMLDVGKELQVWVTHEISDLPMVVEITDCSILVLVLNISLLGAKKVEWPEKYLEHVKQDKIYIVCSDHPTESAAAVSNLIDIDKFKGWQPVVRSSQIEGNPEYFKDFYRALSSKINYRTLSKSTALGISYLFIRNSLINAPLANFHKELVTFKDKCQNKPILIVSSGPSLNKQMPTLAQFRELFTILSVDTAWPILNKHGIEPDMLFALDPVQTPSWPRDGLAEQTCLAVDIGCGPLLVWSDLKNQLFIQGDQARAYLLREIGLTPDMLQTGGSVATSAFSFARHLGGAPIVLIGQDLALTDGKDHADGYPFAYDSQQLTNRKEMGFEVEGYHGGRVRTERQLMYYKNWFETQAKENPDLFVINATEGGAKIQGFLQIPFLKTCQQLSNIPFENKIFPKYERTEFDAEHMEKLKLNLRLLIQKAEQYVKLMEKGKDLIDQRNKISKIKLFKQIDRLNKKIKKYDLSAKIVVNVFGSSSIENIRFETSVDKTEATINRVLDRYLSLYSKSLVAGEKCIALLKRINEFYQALSERGCFDHDLLNELMQDKAINP